MLGRLTAGARAAVALAEEEAVALGHDYIGTEHLLLGLAGTEDGVAGRVLASFGVTRDGLVGSVAGEVGRGCQARPRRLDSDALASIGIDLDEVRRRVEDAFGPGALERTRAGARALSASRPLVPRAQRALHMASKEARRSRTWAPSICCSVSSGCAIAWPSLFCAGEGSRATRCGRLYWPS